MKTTIASILALTLSSISQAADIRDDLQALVSPSSPGGPSITADDLRSYKDKVVRYSPLEAVQAIALYEPIRTELSAAGLEESVQYGGVVGILRDRVDGLARPLDRFPGLALSRCESNCVRWQYKASSPLAGLSVVYTLNDWQTSGTLNFASSDKLSWQVELRDPKLTPQAKLKFAVRFTSLDGRKNWFNNPRESGLYAGGVHLDYTYPLSAIDAKAAELAQPFAALLEACTLADSDQGETITSNEFSMMVGNLTFFGGSDLYTWEVAAGLSRKLSELQQRGIPFEGGVWEGMSNFFASALSSYIFGTYPQVQATTLANGQTALQFYEQDLRAMQLNYSTDGWNTVRKADCSEREGRWICPLGDIPLGVPLAYRPRFFYKRSGESRPTVNGNHAFYQVLGGL